MTRTPYLTDLSDAEWNCIASLFPAPALHGRPRLHSSREIFNAILSLLRSGCAWRLLPHDLPPYKTVSHSFRLCRRNGPWEQIHTMLRERVRLKMGREAQPSAAIIDSQSVKTIGLPGPHGYDAGKKIKGRKHHLLVDTVSARDIMAHRTFGESPARIYRCIKESKAIRYATSSMCRRKSSKPARHTSSFSTF